MKLDIGQPKIIGPAIALLQFMSVRRGSIQKQGPLSRSWLAPSGGLLRTLRDLGDRGPAAAGRALDLWSALFCLGHQMRRPVASIMSLRTVCAGQTAR